MKKIFVIDWILLVVAALSAYSGIELHVVGHGDVHEIWHNWAVVHVITSLLFLIFGVVHIKMHWGWYKSLFVKGIRNKSRVTLLLSVIFIVVILTGVALLAFVDGANSGMGLWHYRIGLIVSAISIGHIVKRWHILKKSIESK